MTTTEQAFQIGSIYSTGESRDYVWRFKVIKRTAKFITVQDILSGETRRVGVTNYGRGEIAYPLGTYSMCPSITATEVPA